MKVTLPWPPPALWPNRPTNWAKKAKAKRDYKRTAWALAYGERPTQGPLKLAITFHPPTSGKRDLDNMLAAIKAGIDGLSLAWGIDDSRFGYEIERGEPVKGGCVVIVVKNA